MPEWPAHLRDEKRREYREYMASAQWKNIRDDMLRLRGQRCERCGEKKARQALEVHHKTYENLGNENPSELEVLCGRCHEIADEERAEEKRRSIQGKARRTRYRNALETYARKKYGEHWSYNPHDYARIKREFNEWLDRKRLEESGY